MNISIKNEKSLIKWYTLIKEAKMKKTVRKHPEQLKKLSQGLINIQIGLETICNSFKKRTPKPSTQCQALMSHIQQIGHVAMELESIKSLVLAGKDYTNFCFLIIHGSDMADYLLSLKSSNNISRQHALDWKKLALKFRPFLEENANHSSHKLIMNRGVN